MVEEGCLYVGQASEVRKYTPEFREQAARLVIETGRPAAHVAAEISVGEQLLGRWVRLARAQGDDPAYRDYRDRYRAMATSLGFEGHIAWAEAMP